jgi:hypothetical protein
VEWGEAAFAAMRLGAAWNRGDDRRTPAREGDAREGAARLGDALAAAAFNFWLLILARGESLSCAFAIVFFVVWWSCREGTFFFEAFLQFFNKISSLKTVIRFVHSPIMLYQCRKER